jgi:hypothetical protein
VPNATCGAGLAANFANNLNSKEATSPQRHKEHKEDKEVKRKLAGGESPAAYGSIASFKH